MGESALRDAIRDTLNATGRVWLEVNAKGGRRHRYGLMPDGSADLIGMMRGGKFFAVEVKMPGKVRFVEQLEWAERVAAMGGFVACASTVQMALDALRAAEKEVAERAERSSGPSRWNY